MNEWVIYKHTFPNGKCYIGKTSQKPEDRWGKNGRLYQKQELIWRAIQKYGWENVTHEILYEGLTDEEANIKEIECIAKYHSFVGDNPSMGYNATLGGEGFALITDEEREEILKLWQEGKTIKEIRELSSFNKEQIRKTLTKAKISKNERVQRSAEKYNGYVIYQYDLQGNFIANFLTAYEAMRETGVPQQNICKCIKGKRHTAGGYQWSNEKKEMNPITKGPGFYKKVYRYDLNHNLIAIYNSGAEASQKTGYDVNRIRKLAKSQEKGYNSIWSYEPM